MKSWRHSVMLTGPGGVPMVQKKARKAWCSGSGLMDGWKLLEEGGVKKTALVTVMDG